MKHSAFILSGGLHPLRCGNRSSAEMTQNDNGTAPH